MRQSQTGTGRSFGWRRRVSYSVFARNGDYT
jgi:hypothetical protein